jgi:hypothetical protein
MIFCGLPLTKTCILFTSVNKISKNKKTGICCHLQVAAAGAGKVPRKKVLRKIGFY